MIRFRILEQVFVLKWLNPVLTDSLLTITPDRIIMQLRYCIRVAFITVFFVSRGCIYTKQMQAQESQSKQDKLVEVAAVCTCFNLRKASRAVTQIFDEILHPSGLRTTQFNLLVSISMVNSANITDLAQGLVMDRTTLTRNLKPLEKQGLIEIFSGQDHRMRFVTLTASGYEALAKALPLWEQAQARIVKELGRHQWSKLLIVLSETTSLFQST